jgi:hypothetical protein
MQSIFDHTHMTAGPLWDSRPTHGWTQVVEQYDWSDDNSAELAKGWIKKGDTLEELAAAVGLDALALVQSVERWNVSCAAGEDSEYGRSMILNPLETAPYYAIEMAPSMLNTQGGPRRNEKAQIVRPGGAPIPRLYSAGELL